MLVAVHVSAAVVDGEVHVDLVAAFCDGVIGGLQSAAVHAAFRQKEKRKLLLHSLHFLHVQQSSSLCV